MGKFCIGVLFGAAAVFAFGAWLYDDELKQHNVSRSEDHSVDELIEVAGHNRESVMQVIGPDGEILKSITFVRND